MVLSALQWPCTHLNYVTNLLFPSLEQTLNV